MRPIAALLGSAVEHWRMWDGERRRRERLEQVEALLGTLAESLDVREVFETLSAVLQGFLPHHLAESHRAEPEARARFASWRSPAAATFRFAPTPSAERARARESQGLRDRRRHPGRARAGERAQPPDSSVGPALVAPCPAVDVGRDQGKSRASCTGSPGGTPAMTRICAPLVAARVALTLSHQRLAEEARVAAVSRERAERLEATVETLARAGVPQPEPRGRHLRPWKEALLQVGRVASSDTTVLITGESGTGKEVISRAGSSEIGASEQAVRRHQLRGAPRAAARVRAVRPREGRVHRRDRQPGWAGSSRPTEGRCSSTRSRR